MRMRHLLVTATAVAVALAGLSAAPAAADGDHGPVSVRGEVPPGGNLTATSPTLGKDDKVVKLKVEPESSDPAALADFDRFLQSVGSMTKQQKLLTCVLIFNTIASLSEVLYDREPDLNINYLTFAATVAGACLRLSGLVSARTVPRSSSAGAKCGQLLPSVRATITKSAGGYTLTTTGAVKKKKGPLKVRCKATASGLTYTVKPRKKGQTLRQVVGDKLMIGLQSPADATTTVPVKVTFS